MIIPACDEEVELNNVSLSYPCSESANLSGILLVISDPEAMPCFVLIQTFINLMISACLTEGLDKNARIWHLDHAGTRTSYGSIFDQRILSQM